MNIPNKIIEAIEALPVALKPELFFAVISYMQSETIPAAGQISVEGQIEFAKILKVLNPILRRRRQQAEYRRRKKLERQQQAQNQGKQQKASQPEPAKQPAHYNDCDDNPNLRWVGDRYVPRYSVTPEEKYYLLNRDKMPYDPRRAARLKEKLRNTRGV